MMLTLKSPPTKFTKRYKVLTEEKADGATYTPSSLARFVAERIVANRKKEHKESIVRILDPAIGDGELLIQILEEFKKQEINGKIEVFGFETNPEALKMARGKIKKEFSKVLINFKEENFLEYVIEHFDESGNGNLFKPDIPEKFDLIIANPPYVRTQIMGAKQAQFLAKKFGLSGRVDLYYPFILGMARVLKPNGVAGIIVSNRFMTTKSGSDVRSKIRKMFNLRHVWDLGDTKIFDAAILPAVLLVEGKNGHIVEAPNFTSIYETNEKGQIFASNPVEALSQKGIVTVADGRSFRVQHGTLFTNGSSEDVWRLRTEKVDEWLEKVKSHTWGTFGNIGKIRVGVKTCADKVFIRSDWDELKNEEKPELLKPLTTHHVARRFKPIKGEKERKILYPHESIGRERRAANLSLHPKSEAYLEKHREILQSRKYVMDSGRQWYEIWVPQDPEVWEQPKLVFRDIAKESTFWIDAEGTVVNGDCYWLACKDPSKNDLLWLAAGVGNSTFIETFYDHVFHNKLYSGRRRFITQYVEQFPLPDPKGPAGKEIIQKAKNIFKVIPSPESHKLQKELEKLVWEAFGLVFEEV